MAVLELWIRSQHRGGNIDGEAYDEIVTGKGPGAYDSEVRTWDADGGVNPDPNNPKHTFMAFSGTTWGTNVGTLDANGDGKFEIAAGKGPGNPTGMDSEVRIFQLQLGSWNQKASVVASPRRLEDPARYLHPDPTTTQAPPRHSVPYETGLSIQRRLHFQGVPMVILPIRARQWRNSC